MFTRMIHNPHTSRSVMTEGSSSFGEAEMPNTQHKRRGWVELPEFLHAPDQTPDLKRGVSVVDLLSGDGPYDPRPAVVPFKDSQAIVA